MIVVLMLIVDYEWVANFKVLQNVFQKMEVTKHVDVEKLVKGKYQDNLEFLQWMKNFFETKYTGQVCATPIAHPSVHTCQTECN
jgi:hypothetical protein